MPKIVMEDDLDATTTEVVFKPPYADSDLSMSIKSHSSKRDTISNLMAQLSNRSSKVSSPTTQNRRNSSVDSEAEIELKLTRKQKNLVNESQVIPEESNMSADGTIILDLPGEQIEGIRKSAKWERKDSQEQKSEETI